MSANVTDPISNPTCTLLPSVNLGVGIFQNTLEIHTKIITKGFLKNNELYFRNLASISEINYIHNSSSSTTKDETTKKNDFYGFKLKVPKYEVKLPSVTIPGYPKINWGCNECEQDDFPPVCDWEKKKKKICVKFKGVKVCEKVNYYAPGKCFNELIIEKKKFPEINFFDIAKLDLEFSFQIIPDFEIDTILLLGNFYGIDVTYGTNPGTVPFGARYNNLQILKFKGGLKIRIKKLQFYYDEGIDRKGFSIQNLTIPLIPALDLLSGEKLLNIQSDAAGNLTVYYLIRTFDMTLYDVLNAIIDDVNNVNDAIPGETTSVNDAASVNGVIPVKGSNLLQQIIKNAGPVLKSILKATKLTISMGFLICPMPTPKEDVFLSFAISTYLSCYPFQNLDEVKIPDIPSKYNIPNIPNNDYLSDNDTENLNNINQKSIQPAIKKAEKAIVNIAEHVKNKLETVKIYAGVQIFIPIIPKSLPAAPHV
jgi:hypothetical protein